jgi:phage terminase large subunit
MKTDSRKVYQNSATVIDQDLCIELVEKLDCLYEPWRYKVLEGGRGGIKSWSIATALLVKGLTEEKRILCTREIQNSIKESVYQLLCDRIKALQLWYHYNIFQDEIKGRNGTLFSFKGLSAMTVGNLKSFEAYDICWVEEAQFISKKSWETIIPTIRKNGSEFWISMNGDLDTDETWKRFCKPWYEGKRDAETIVVHLDYRDNPWWNETMEKDRLKCKREQPDDYPNIYLGICRPAAAGAIYYKEVAQAQAWRRIGRVPYDPFLKVHVVWDLGWGDHTFIILVQKNASEVRIIGCMSGTRLSLEHYSQELRKLSYNWGRIWLPHDGFSGKLESAGRSTYDILTALGWDCATREEITELSIEEGIRVARMTFPQVYFDESCMGENAEYEPLLIECLKRYKRIINRNTGTASGPLHDTYADGADGFRYVCVNLPNMKNEELRRVPVTTGKKRRPLDPWAGY